MNKKEVDDKMQEMFGDQADSRLDQMMYNAYKKGVYKAFHKGTKLAEKHGGAQGIKQLLTVLRKMKLREDKEKMT